MSTKETKNPVKIFCCYARKDQDLLVKLHKHLHLLSRQGLIDILSDINISPGANWQKIISQYINTAQIVLLLVSPDFMSSDYCYSIEMRRALERHKSGNVQVIPIILRPVSWQGAPFGELQVLPTGAVPIVSNKWHTQDEAFVNVIESLRKIFSSLLLKRTPQDSSDPIQQSSGVDFGQNNPFNETRDIEKKDNTDVNSEVDFGQNNQFSQMGNVAGRDIIDINDGRAHKQHDLGKSKIYFGTGNTFGTVGDIAGRDIVRKTDSTVESRDGNDKDFFTGYNYSNPSFMEESYSQVIHRTTMPLSGETFLDPVHRDRITIIIKGFIEESHTIIEYMLVNSRISADSINFSQPALTLAREIVMKLEKLGRLDEKHHALGAFLDEARKEASDPFLKRELISYLRMYNLLEELIVDEETET